MNGTFLLLVLAGVAYLALHGASAPHTAAGPAPTPSQIWGDQTAQFGGIPSVSGNTITYRDWLAKYWQYPNYTGSNWSTLVPDRPVGAA